MAFRCAQKLANALLETKAINDYNWKVRERKSRAKQLAEDWFKQQREMRTIQVDHSLNSLRKSLEGTRKQLDKAFGTDFSNLPPIASTPEHLCILSSNGEVLGYRMRYDARFLPALDKTTAALPPCPQVVSDRGEFEERHYAVWADYKTGSVPFLSLDYRADDERGNGAASEWVEGNAGLLRAVSNAHRCIVPQEYGRVVMAGNRISIKLGLKPLFKGWFGAAIHQNMTGKHASGLHLDGKDYSLSCLIPWGEFKGGNLVLVQLGLKVEIRPGDAFFFRSSHIVHQLDEVEGTRGVVTLFSHTNTFTWADRQERIRKGQETEKDIRAERAVQEKAKKEKLKRQTDEDAEQSQTKRWKM